MRAVKWVLLGAGLALGAGCRNEPQPPADPTVAAAARAAERASEAPEGRDFRATPEKLDAYVRYQRRLLEEQGRLWKELQGVAARLDAGAELSQDDLTRSLRAIEGKRASEEKARAEAGLTEADVNALMRLVTDVIGQRYTARLMKYDEELAKLEQVARALPEGKRGSLDGRLEALRREVEVGRTLPEARREHGDANVDAVLAREADLMKNYEQMLQQYAGRAP